ncbi:MAG: hypothetical protein HC785_03870 [Calothrix sp. CSU_2_0]|nr:hypothetical protein [Calothrix sp. CSU_2_0]
MQRKTISSDAKIFIHLENPKPLGLLLYPSGTLYPAGSAERNEGTRRQGVSTLRRNDIYI